MNRLRELRQEIGITMKEVAESLHIPYTTYVNYEKGVREPNSEMLIKLADFYDCTIDYLLGKSEDNKSSTMDSALDRIYLNLAKEAQEKGIDPDDIRLAIETINRIKKK